MYFVKYNKINKKQHNINIINIYNEKAYTDIHETF